MTTSFIGGDSFSLISSGSGGGGGGGAAVIILGGGCGSSVRCAANNTASGTYSFAAGQCNSAISNGSGIVSGFCNTVCGVCSFIGGGTCNVISAGCNNAILNGGFNQLSGCCSSILGGSLNIITNAGVGCSSSWSRRVLAGATVGADRGTRSSDGGGELAHRAVCARQGPRTRSVLAGDALGARGRLGA